MPAQSHFVGNLIRATGIGLVLAAIVPPAFAQTNFTVLKNFTGVPDGAVPICTLVLSNEVFYGTTAGGGSNNLGTVFKMNRDGSGFSILKHFAGADGAGPFTGLLYGSDGALYGTTYGGGVSNIGTLFKLERNGSGFMVLHEFTGGSDSKNPRGALIEGRDGGLYGTTDFGNSTTRGTVFRINKDGSGYTLLHTFTGTPDGQNPQAKLLQASDGMLYGTTVGGGSSIWGAVFRMNTNGGDFSIVHSFVSADGRQPMAGLIEDSDGVLYGTTYQGPASGFSGTVFKMNKDGGGMFYGTAQQGGQTGGGCVFALSAEPFAPWALTLSRSGGPSVINFAGTAATQYDVQRSTNLFFWSDIVTLMAPAHGRLSYTNADASEPLGFFRARKH